MTTAPIASAVPVVRFSPLQPCQPSNHPKTLTTPPDGAILKPCLSDSADRLGQSKIASKTLICLQDLKNRVEILFNATAE
jgi:hypothetical protein